ncbi:MAG TPA: hypothetical protein ACFYD6_03215 [Candidatus Brocadiia bacterium]|nr:hypothetical protein [Planctomycetota bacterium]MDO8093484.1 hypothetical protein [Candidatus Brocadiales bacterium]
MQKKNVPPYSIGIGGVSCKTAVIGARFGVPKKAGFEKSTPYLRYVTSS